MRQQRPLPDTDSDAAVFWKGAAQQNLLIQRCTRCGGYQHYARPFCIRCNDTGMKMVEASGRGTLHSFTVVHRAPYDDLPAPYVVALIKLEEGPMILSNIVDCDPESLKCDIPVEVGYQSLRDGVVLPVFRPRAVV
jgi:uncharacterized OB-fold protein